MTDKEFITELFCRVDDMMQAAEQHPLAKMVPSEIVTIGMVFALKGVGTRAFYRWFSRNFKAEFPKLLERTRFFRVLTKYREWVRHFLAEEVQRPERSQEFENAVVEFRLATLSQLRTQTALSCRPWHTNSRAPC